MLMNAQSLGKDYTFTKPYACIYTLVYIHTSYTLTHIWIHNHSRDYTYASTNICANTHKHLSSPMHSPALVHSGTYMYLRIHTLTQTLLCIHMREHVHVHTK